MSALDWNWFFSTLSQSAAAITGIFGGFIITKIFSNQSHYYERTRALTEIIAEADIIKAEASTFRFQWYKSTVDAHAIREIIDYLEEYCHCTNPEDFKAGLKQLPIGGFSIFTRTHEALEIVDDLIVKKCAINKKHAEESIAKETIDSETKLTDHSKQGPTSQKPDCLTYQEFTFNKFNKYHLPPSILKSKIFHEEYPAEELEKELVDFKKTYSKARRHAHSARQLFDTIKGQLTSHWQISGSLALVAVIFFAGVIYPLSFLPASGAPDLQFTISAFNAILFSVKGFLLFIVSLAFLSVVMVFLITNINLKYKRAELIELRNLSELDAYSAHFKFLN